ncbi:MAG: hypothetical protein ACOX7T_09220 [Pseudoflavonifractor sp.]
MEKNTADTPFASCREADAGDRKSLSRRPGGFNTGKHPAGAELEACPVPVEPELHIKLYSGDGQKSSFRVVGKMRKKQRRKNVKIHKYRRLKMCILNENAKNVPKCYMTCIKSDLYGIRAYFKYASPFTKQAAKDYIFLIKTCF